MGMGRLFGGPQIGVKLSLAKAGPRPQGLLAVPTEVLLLIMQELEWDDVIRLRTVSRYETQQMNLG
jgi:hypothetical protein